MQHYMNTDSFFPSCPPTPWEMPISTITTTAAAVDTCIAPHFIKHEHEHQHEHQLPQFDEGSFMHMLYTMPSPALELPAPLASVLPVSSWYMPDCSAPALINHTPYYLGQAPVAAPVNHSMLNTPPSPPLSVISNEGFMPPSPLPAHISYTSSPSTIHNSNSNSNSNSSNSSSSSTVISSAVNSPNTIYQCHACTKKFTRPYNLKSHMRTHTDDRPFACNQDGCPWKFARPHDLKRHQLLHSGHKPHECSHCEKRFARRDALRRHWKVDRECGEAEERTGLSSTRRYRRKKISKLQNH